MITLRNKLNVSEEKFNEVMSNIEAASQHPNGLQALGQLLCKINNPPYDMLHYDESLMSVLRNANLVVRTKEKGSFTDRENIRHDYSVHKMIDPETAGIVHAAIQIRGNVIELLERNAIVKPQPLVDSKTVKDNGAVISQKQQQQQNHSGF